MQSSCSWATGPGQFRVQGRTSDVIMLTKVATGTETPAAHCQEGLRSGASTL